MDYKELSRAIIAFRNSSAGQDLDYDLPYQDWYHLRNCISHQKKTRGDEYWFANQVGGNIKGSGKQFYEPFNRKVDFGDGYIGDTIEPGVNNYDLKVTFQDRPQIKQIGFQQYRPADPVAFYAAFMGTNENDYTLIVVPSDVALQMKIGKIERTGNLGSAHGTGLYDEMTTEQKVQVLTEAKSTGKSSVLSFSVNQGSDREDFDMLMDNYRMRLEDVAGFISNYNAN